MDEQEDRLHPPRDEISWLVRTTAASLNNDPVRGEEREVQETYLAALSSVAGEGAWAVGCVHIDPGQEERPSGCHGETKLPSPLPCRCAYRRGQVWCIQPQALVTSL